MLVTRTASWRVANAFSTRANLAKIQPENRQNVQKTRFMQKAPGVNGLIERISQKQKTVIEHISKHLEAR